MSWRNMGFGFKLRRDYSLALKWREALLSGMEGALGGIMCRITLSFNLFIYNKMSLYCVAPGGNQVPLRMALVTMATTELSWALCAWLTQRAVAGGSQPPWRWEIAPAIRRQELGRAVIFEAKAPSKFWKQLLALVVSWLLTTCIHCVQELLCMVIPLLLENRWRRHGGHV